MDFQYRISCAIRDLKDYRDGIFSKRKLCEYLAKDLRIIALPLWEFILILFISNCISILVYH